MFTRKGDAASATPAAPVASTRRRLNPTLPKSSVVIRSSLLW
jgi:hypothetical protein